MAEKVLYGIIGRNISYSFSKKYFSQKFSKLLLSDHHYEVFDIDSEEKIPDLLQLPNLKGLNVTIPYKEKILPYLDELSPEAAAIGAVNTVKIVDGKSIGFNTDTFGFEKTLQIHRGAHHNAALILGNGGAAKAVQYVLRQHSIPFLTVSRKSPLNFETLTAETVAQHALIIQCTPVGTHPDDDQCLQFPFEALSPDHLIIDLIYNPAYTQFIKKAADRKAKTVNGLYMLEQQAEKAWEIWNF